jgi:hypothetical protein
LFFHDCQPSILDVNFERFFSQTLCIWKKLDEHGRKYVESQQLLNLEKKHVSYAQLLNITRCSCKGKNWLAKQLSKRIG